MQGGTCSGSRSFLAWDSSPSLALMSFCLLPVSALICGMIQQSRSARHLCTDAFMRLRSAGENDNTTKCSDHSRWICIRKFLLKQKMCWKMLRYRQTTKTKQNKPSQNRRVTAYLVQLGAVQGQRLHLLLRLSAGVGRQAAELVGLLLGAVQRGLRLLLLRGQLLCAALGGVRIGSLQAADRPFAVSNPVQMSAQRKQVGLHM